MARTTLIDLSASGGMWGASGFRGFSTFTWDLAGLILTAFGGFTGFEETPLTSILIYRWFREIPDVNRKPAKACESRKPSQIS